MKKKAAHVPREDVETNQRGMSPWTGPEAPSPMRPPDVSQTNRDVRTAASKAGIKVQQSQQNAGRAACAFLEMDSSIIPEQEVLHSPALSSPRTPSLRSPSRVAAQQRQSRSPSIRSPRPETSVLEDYEFLKVSTHRRDMEEAVVTSEGLSFPASPKEAESVLTHCDTSLDEAGLGHVEELAATAAAVWDSIGQEQQETLLSRRPIANAIASVPDDQNSEGSTTGEERSTQRADPASFVELSNALHTAVPSAPVVPPLDLPATAGGQAGYAEEDKWGHTDYVVSGPWGGRRWVPKSKLYPQFAMPLRWFKTQSQGALRRQNHADIFMTGGGAPRSQRSARKARPDYGSTRSLRLMKGRESEGTGNSALSAGTDLLQRHGKGYISPSLADCSQATNFEGLGSLRTREKLPLDSFARGNMQSRSLGGDMSTLAPIPSVGSDDFEANDTPFTGAKAPFNAVKDAGEWMSKMWMGTLDMTCKMYDSAEVKAGTGGRGFAWLTAGQTPRETTVRKSESGIPLLTPRESHAESDHIGKRQLIRLKTGLKPVDSQVSGIIKRNPYEKFDEEKKGLRPSSKESIDDISHDNRHGLHSVSGTGIGIPRQRTQLTPRGNSSSHGIFPVNQERNDKDDVEPSSTFLTDMPGHSDQGPQTARGPSAPGLPPLSARGPGMHTARVPGAKAERPPPKKKDNKMAAAAMYLAINADKTVNRNRAANVGWTAQDFRPSFANVREEIPRRRLSQTYALDSVQLASACLTLHTSTTPQDVAAAVRRAVSMVVGAGSECILLRAIGPSAVSNYEADSDTTTVAVELGCGVVGCALTTSHPMTWNVLDEDLSVMLEAADSAVGIREIGMVYTSPLCKTSGLDSRRKAPMTRCHAVFGLFVVQRMFGSFDTSELEMLNVIAEHASTAFSKHSSDMTIITAAIHQRHMIRTEGHTASPSG